MTPGRDEYLLSVGWSWRLIHSGMHSSSAGIACLQSVCNQTALRTTHTSVMPTRTDQCHTAFVEKNTSIRMGTLSSANLTPFAAHLRPRSRAPRHRRRCVAWASRACSTCAALAAPHRMVGITGSEEPVDRDNAATGGQRTSAVAASPKPPVVSSVGPGVGDGSPTCFRRGGGAARVKATERAQRKHETR